MLISEITGFLEQAYDVLNQQYFEGVLPKVIITVQSSPKAYGHYTTWDAWREEQQGYREINIGAETLNRPIQDTIGTLIHEMVHYYCDISGIKDVSRGGVYHNKRFKAEAEQRGLIIDYSSSIGFSVTTPSDSLVEFIGEQGWAGVDLARTGGHSSSGGGSAGGGGGAATGVDGTGKKKGSTRKYVCPNCGISCRATKTINIGCLDCGTVMEIEEK